MTEKKCCHCGDLKPIDDFSSNKSKEDGHQNYCRKCGKIYRRKGYLKNKDSEQASRIKYYHKHQEKLNKYHDSYRKLNPERAKQWNKNYYNKRKDNPLWRLNSGLSISIGTALRGKKAGRHWETLVGYTISDLIKHLEAKFVDGMAWENYGKWHVDHIIPKSKFFYVDTNDPQFRECWGLNNLQPLWAKDNRRKWCNYSSDVK